MVGDALDIKTKLQLMLAMPVNGMEKKIGDPLDASGAALGSAKEIA